MLRSKLSVLGLSGFFFFFGPEVAAANDIAPSLRSLWPVKSSHAFHQALPDEIGFSFRYDGKKIGPPAPAGWKISHQEGAAGLETTFRHPSGLAVIRQARAFPEFEAVEYTVRFKSESKEVLPAIARIDAMDLTFGKDILGGVSVVSSGGGLADAFYPPRQFALARHYLGPVDPVEGNQVLVLSTKGGRSSFKDLPFFFVDNEEKDAGIFVAMGWSGQWSVRFSGAHKSNLLRMDGGMPGINIRLQPGEEISGPTILLGCYRGPLSSGSNRLRRLIRDRYRPEVAGEELPIVLYDSWFHIQCDFDEEMLRSVADAAAETGHEYFMIDACWYEGTTRDPNWRVWDKVSRSLGNWEKEEPDKFPSGLKAFSDYVRSRGMKFGLWFEPERVARGTRLEKAHPEWVFWRSGNPRWGFVDFGRSEVQKWVIQMLDRHIRNLGIHYIRWDMNFGEPLIYWTEMDAPDRRGIAQIRHLEGLHRVEDWLRENHPRVILESCAGGGTRIDLETVRRRPTIFISDQTQDPRLVRFHLAGLNHFLPGSYQMVSVTQPVPFRQRTDVPDIVFQSYFAGAFGSAGKLHEWPPVLRRQARKHFDVFKKLRKFISEDYYLLLPQPRGLKSWEGWQFHNPQTHEGFVQVFRTQAPDSSRTVAAKALKPDADYRFTDAYTGESFDMAGAKAVGEGLEFNLPPMTSKVLTYERVR